MNCEVKRLKMKLRNDNLNVLVQHRKAAPYDRPCGELRIALISLCCRLIPASAIFSDNVLPDAIVCLVQGTI